MLRHNHRTDKKKTVKKEKKTPTTPSKSSSHQTKPSKKKAPAKKKKRKPLNAAQIAGLAKGRAKLKRMQAAGTVPKYKRKKKK